MTCSCGCTKWDTFNTRHRDTYVYRRKECMICRTRVTTHETIYIEEYNMIQIPMSEYATLTGLRDSLLGLIVQAKEMKG